jgi:hypothetical protein
VAVTVETTRTRLGPYSSLTLRTLRWREGRKRRFGGTAPFTQGGLDVIRKEAWPSYRTSSGVRLCWELEEPKGPKGNFKYFLYFYSWFTRSFGMSEVPLYCTRVTGVAAAICWETPGRGLDGFALPDEAAMNRMLCSTGTLSHSANRMSTPPVLLTNRPERSLRSTRFFTHPA